MLRSKVVDLLKEKAMSEQGLLFKRPRSPWVDRLWDRIPAEKRREIISMLADLARKALIRREDESQEEKADES